MIEPLVEANAPFRQVAEELPHDVAANWLASFESVMNATEHRAPAVSRLFCPDGWWRDAVAFTWDLRTSHATNRIEEFVDGLPAGQLRDVKLAPDIEITVTTEPTEIIEAFFEFRVEAGSGRGIVRLMRVDDGWRAWTLLTSLEELDGHQRPIGVHRSTGQDPGRGLWHEERDRTLNMLDGDPDVVIVGAGQSGLGLAAELRMLGLKALVIERAERVGDNWRNRYPSLVLHDPVWADHLPYMPFPAFWPIYTPKEKLADWLEMYANVMELNVWTKSELVASEYEDDAGDWTLEVLRDGRQRTITTSHLVLASGPHGPARVPDIANAEAFKGEVVHSSRYAGGTGRAGQRAVVVGASSSGHDIAADLFASGAEVTMVQRSSIYVMSQANGIPALFGQVYFEGGPPLDQTDLRMLSYPALLSLSRAPAQTRAIAEADRELLDGLAAAGMLLDMGVDGGGLMSKVLKGGSGYYIDVGTSSLIAQGKIKIHVGAGTARFTEHGIVLDDGAELPADVVVLATGYRKMGETIEAMFGREVADRCGTIGGMDEEGETAGMWRPSGHPGLWFAGGSLMMVRHYARYLALQLKAAQMGINYQI